MPDTSSELISGIVDGDRRALARAITLVESTRADHRDQAAEVLEALLDRTGASVRLGISGPPGVGKSTFIEALGLHVAAEAHRVAVLAVDPSSAPHRRVDPRRQDPHDRAGPPRPTRSSGPPPVAPTSAGWPAAPARPCCCARRPASTS